MAQLRGLRGGPRDDVVGAVHKDEQLTVLAGRQRPVDEGKEGLRVGRVLYGVGRAQ